MVQHHVFFFFFFNFIFFYFYNNKDINVKNLSVPLIKWSENNSSVQSDLADFNL